jgi:Flp pilus assembly pilin Flp
MFRNSEFLRREDGVVSIEWVAIAAVAFVAAVAISAALLTGAGNLGGAVAGQMNTTAEQIEGE